MTRTCSPAGDEMAIPPSTSSSKNGSERRRFPRYNVALDVNFGPISASGGRPTHVQLERTITVNLSLGGLCLYSDGVYPIGTGIVCVMTLPGRATPVEVVGSLAWFQKIDQDAHGYKLGVEFTNMTAEDQTALQELCEHPPAAQASRSKRVLLVDDDEELRLAMQLRFESVGFQVLTAGDGLEALRKGRDEHPHLIVLDLMLPHLNGYEVCRLLKFDQKFRHIPIILCTARCRREDMDMGRTVGADAYVTKPFNGKELIAKVEELLKLGPVVG